MRSGASRAAIIAGVGAVLMAGWAVWTALGERGNVDAERTTPAMRTALGEAFATSGKRLEIETAAAARIPELVAALGQRLDAFTLEDLFASEDWWRPFRERAAVVASIEGSGGNLLATRGPKGLNLAQPALLERARNREGQHLVIVLGERAYLVAAAPIATRTSLFAVILAQPLDAEALAPLSTQAGMGLLLSDGKRVLASVGPGTEAASFAGVAGRETEKFVADADGAWVATPVAMSSGLWAWGVRVMPMKRGFGRSGVLGALAGALVLLSVALGLRNRGRSDPPVVQPASSVSVSHVPQVFGSQLSADGSAVPHAIVSGPGSSPTRSSAVLNSPTVIAAVEQNAFGRYTLLEKLGEGGMCELYTAALVGPEGFQRTFVIKRLKPELTGNRAAVDQFIDEANLGSTLVHSNIVPVYDFGKAGDAFFIAQEYIVGRNISEILARHHERLGEPLDPTTVFYIAYETLKGLAYAHRKTTDEGEPLRLVHRDVSPNNIMVSVLGEVKLLDFGIVKAEGRVSHTDLGNVKGNASYMAPEQARGLAVDARTDLFALGLVMFNALTNESFYAGGTAAEVFYQAARGPTADHEARISRLPSPAAGILGRALAADPAMRYQTADDFAAELVSHLPAGTGNNVAALLHALFGTDLRPQSGGSDRIRTTGIRGKRAG